MGTGLRDGIWSDVPTWKIWGFSALAMMAALHAADTTPGGSGRDWPAYGGNPAGTRYSSLKQIDRSNVSRLAVAWTYDTADGPGASQTQPIVVEGVLYGLTPKHKAIALEGATGKELWRFDPGTAGRGPNRGVVYWSDGADRRIFSALDSFVYALNAATGKPIPGFGKDGRIDLREGLGRDPSRMSIVLTSPGIIYKDLLIVGGRTPEPCRRLPETSAPTMREPASFAGPSTPSRIPASTVTRLVRRTPGPTRVRPITGRAWPWSSDR